MIERRPFNELPGEDLGWLKVRHQLPLSGHDALSGTGWRCVRAWNDEEIVTHSGFPLQVHAAIKDIDVVTIRAIDDAEVFIVDVL